MTIHSILSPLPGTFYRSAAPGQPPFKTEGDTVRAGDILGLIEVMKQFTEVTSEGAGKLVRFHADNESAIDAGAPLIDLDLV